MKPSDDETGAGGGDLFSEIGSPLGAALPAGTTDPLIHEDTDAFWREIDTYFQPIREPDVNVLRNLDARAKSLGTNDPALRVPPFNSSRRGTDWDTGSISSDGKDSSQANSTKRPRNPNNNGSNNRKKGAAQEDADNTDGDKDDKEDLYQVLNSYPYTHRLVAALIDDGSISSVSMPGVKSKSGHAEDPAWIGPGEEGNLRTFQRSLESRVTAELGSLGLIDMDEEGDLLTELRQGQWVLRDLKMMNKGRRESIKVKVLRNGLKTQAKKREHKKGNDDLEITYLERMMRKCKRNKRVRSKYQKVLNAQFPHHKFQKKDLDDAKDEEPPPSAHHKSVKKKSYNKRPHGSTHTNKAAAKKKEDKSDDEVSFPKQPMDLVVDDVPRF